MLLTPPPVTNCHIFSEPFLLERDVLYGRPLYISKYMYVCIYIYPYIHTHNYIIYVCIYAYRVGVV